MNRTGLILALLLTAVAGGCQRRPQHAAVSPEPPLEGALDARPDVSKMNTGPQLYEALCAACHGLNGAADGPGAQSLYPPPRNLRHDRFRLVSTANHVPTRDDVDRVISLGMPGTSMRAFQELSTTQRKLLVDEVLRLRREGAVELAQRKLSSQGLENDPSVLEEMVQQRTTPGDVITVPSPNGANRAAVERGKLLYSRQGCQACHGTDGIGASGLRLLTDEGVPTRGRDLVREPFKGGPSSESVYLRIALGMPGTPMPASPTLTPGEVADLVAFCQSLAREPKRILTNHQRAKWATADPYLKSLEP